MLSKKVRKRSLILIGTVTCFLLAFLCIQGFTAAEVATQEAGTGVSVAGSETVLASVSSDSRPKAYFGVILPPLPTGRVRTELYQSEAMAPMLTPPSSYSWANNGWNTPVKNQYQGCAHRLRTAHPGSERSFSEYRRLCL